MSEQGLLSGRVVAVSGAGGGIGAELVRVLAREGASLSIADIQPASIERLAVELSEQGIHIKAHTVDVTKRLEAESWIANTEQALGPLYALVNVAGLWRPQPLEEINESDWEQTLDSNLKSAFLCSQAAVPRLRANDGGVIVNFASTSGEYGSISPAAHYAAAKGGIIAFTKSLARELAAWSIRVNAISPGPIDTFALGATSAEQKAAVAKRTLVGRLGTPQDIAEGVLYLVSPAASFVTGHVLRVNGGSLL